MDEVKDRMRRERLRSNLNQSPNQAVSDAFFQIPASNTVHDVKTTIDTPQHISNETVFNMFEKYMTSLDGGDLENSTASTYIQQVKSVMENLKTNQIANLFEKKVMSESFLNQKQKKKEDNPEDFSNELLNKVTNKYVPLTKQKYLTALMHFCDFVSHHLDELKMVLFKREDILHMKTIFSNWRKSLNRQVQLHSSIRAEEDQDFVVTPQHMKRWENGEIKRKAIKLLGELSSDQPPPLNKDKYCALRDYFIVEIVQNGHRSGVCSNMLLSQLNAATFETVEDITFRVFKVKKHKTVRTHGFAKVYLKEHVFNNLKLFVRLVLPGIQGKDNFVFKTFFGRQMSSGEVSTQLNSLWMRADVYDHDQTPTKNISCTMFRKSISTMSLEKQPEGSGAVADLLAHNSSTQAKYYDIRRRDKSSARGAYNICNLWKSPPSPSAEDVTTKPPIPDQITPSRKQWDQSEIDEVWEIFGALKNSEENFGIVDIIKMKSEFIHLKTLPMKKVYDKVRSLRRYRPISIVTKKQVNENVTGDKDDDPKFIPNRTDADDDPDFVPDCVDDDDDEVYPLQSVLYHRGVSKNSNPRM